MIVETDLFTPTDLVRVLGRLQTSKRNDCWPWPRGGQPVVFAGGASWRVRTMLRVAFAVESSQITPCDTIKCQNPYHTSAFSPA